MHFPAIGIRFPWSLEEHCSAISVVEDVMIVVVGLVVVEDVVVGVVVVDVVVIGLAAVDAVVIALVVVGAVVVDVVVVGAIVVVIDDPLISGRSGTHVKGISQSELTSSNVYQHCLNH